MTIETTITKASEIPKMDVWVVMLFRPIEKSNISHWFPYDYFVTEAEAITFAKASRPNHTRIVHIVEKD